MNFEYLYYQKKLCFLHNVRFSDISLMATIMRIFKESDEYTKLCAFKDIHPMDNIL